ncbi:MAG: phosphoribosylanthranilate isomerase, partial [Oscillospiraceae bacterium]|nr:phosphoribosylanthranilate isomerase [Oscillospiraceae bacterium]
MTKIKICGLSRPADIDCVNELCPDYIGFVFAGSSRRHVTSEQAQALRARLCAGITPVGVFVNEPMENILALINSKTIDAVQLHGDEDKDYIVKLKSLTDVPIIKAVPVRRAGDVQHWQTSAADYLLLDAPGGGTGQGFDWDAVGSTNKPFFLAGGLSPQNVTSA